VAPGRVEQRVALVRDQLVRGPAEEPRQRIEAGRAPGGRLGRGDSRRQREPGRERRRAARARAALALCLLASACARFAAPPSPPPPPPAEPSAAERPCDRIERLEVRKALRRLQVTCAGGGERVFPVALSREPVGAKRAQADQRVPEGEYRIAGTARRSRFHLFLPIDYPSPADADRAFAEGLVTRAERDAIERAHAEAELPPQNTALGGHLGFHGEGERWRGEQGLDWTEGCVAVADDVIELLAERAPIGTPVSILP
jgi:hypothetical protein